MNLRKAIAVLDAQAGNPTMGLPEELFLFASRITPLVNVDLLIKDETGCTLLAWRDDPFSGRGWHIPGGIVRFKETLEERVLKVAESEIGAAVTFAPVPLAINTLIHPTRNTRGHFVSVLYACTLPGTFVPPNTGRSREEAGFLAWHDACPENLIRVHEIYRAYI